MNEFPVHWRKDRLECFCQEHHITYLAFFWSVLTQKFTSQSDVDILVRFEEQHIPHLFSFVSMESELSEIMGRSVDLRTP
ncbi:MAG: nucleotidyltransferase [Chlamydiae bacterium]|nr:nucleotidyltransferase [Chlamydiota bacterium]